MIMGKLNDTDKKYFYGIVVGGWSVYDVRFGYGVWYRRWVTKYDEQIK